jgi:hypothetical protein
VVELCKKFAKILKTPKGEDDYNEAFIAAFLELDVDDVLAHGRKKCIVFVYLVQFSFMLTPS